MTASSIDNYHDFVAELAAPGRLREELVPPALLNSQLFKDAYNTRIIDDIKKALFYGRDTDLLDYWRDQLGHTTGATYDVVHKDLLHAILGMRSESGELIELLYTALVDKTEIDRTKLISELGDVLWYLALACNVLGINLWDVIDGNVTKLLKRFPNAKFSEALAINKNVDAENELLSSV
jgi:NTP pyrophosphatase (non-canonical NTP hydrolase)